MTGRAAASERTRGSILLPVIVVLLLIASAATAMTLQLRTSLSEAATRRDRLALGYLADAVVRSAALALSLSTEQRTPPPFALDGTPQSCRLPGGGLLVLAVQDEGGLVDLNKGARELIAMVLQRAGLSGWDAKAMTDAIMQRREPNNAPARPTERARSAEPPGRVGFASVDEIDGLHGMTPDAADRLRPALTVASGSPGVDPTLAAPGLKALISPKELTGPDLSAALSPSAHTAFAITATAMSRQGTRVQRRSTLQFGQNGAAAGRFTTWDAPVGFDSLTAIPSGAFCVRLAVALKPA